MSTHEPRPLTKSRLRAIGRLTTRWLSTFAPKGLYARSLLIVIMPMVILQAVLTYAFMDRHYQSVTKRLSSAMVQNIAILIDLHEAPDDPLSDKRIMELAERRFGLSVEFSPKTSLPPKAESSLFDLLNDYLVSEAKRTLRQPHWIDTSSDASLIEIRVALKQSVMSVVARRSQASASNFHIFLVWMLTTAIILVSVSVLFLRNQIRPILQLGDAAEDLGKGRDVAPFKARGAREVREATRAFFEMKRRVERQIEQRTAMLAGVSHDLRTLLTRFRLSLALAPQNEDSSDMQRDVDEMARMLEAYLAFARGDSMEQATPTDVKTLLEIEAEHARALGRTATCTYEGEPFVTLRADAFRRLLGNLTTNACRHATTLGLHGRNENRWLTIHIDDNGPGITPENREEVFKPFFRLDEARNQDETGTGLGLAIARDIARSHGGDITLHDSPLGGLRATIHVPV
jgi:two-component system, OmpR family, osmolarity sensor histidine kinase EnvZ